MKKKYLILIAVLLLVSPVPFTLIKGATPAATLSLNPSVVPTQNLSVGSTFSIVLHIDNVNNLWQWAAGLSWNPAVLLLQGSPKEGPFLKNEGSTLFPPAAVDNTLGVLYEMGSVLMSSSSASGSGDLATVTFKVVGQGHSDINITNPVLRDPGVSPGAPHLPIEFTFTNATFDFPSANPSPSPSNSPSPSPGQTNSTSEHSPTAKFIPEEGMFYLKGDKIVLDATQSTGGYDLAGTNETCPISNYAWRVEYLNGTVFKTFSGQIANFAASVEADFRIILIVTAIDPHPPSFATFSATDSTSAIVHVQSAETATNIDVFTEKGGMGKNTAGGPYGPDELIEVYAHVTYHNSSLVNKDVAFTIRNQNGTDSGVRVGRTNAEGVAYAEFRLPWPDTDNPEIFFGNWSILATVDVSQVTVNDTVTFSYNYIITTQGVSVPAFVQKLDNIPINITVNSLNESPTSSMTIAITVFDSYKVPIYSFILPNIKPTLGNSTITATIFIPSWAFLGQATIYVNVLTDAPNNDGVPYSREREIQIQIQ